MAGIPIKFQEHLQLSSAGVPDQAIGFNTCTLESDRYVCVRETSEAGNTVAIIDLHDNNNVVRRNMAADSAIMHPSKFIIALKGSTGALQVFNLDTKERLKSASISENVVFWKWINDKTLGLITDTSIYHWDIIDSTQASPVKLTNRHDSLSGCQIINYQSSSNENWSCLVGISQREGRIVGNIQLYSKSRNISQAIEGHAASFALLKLEDSSVDTSLFTFANRTPTGAKLHIIEIDHQEGAPIYQKKAVDIFFPPEAANDFPVSVITSNKYGVIYVITKYGFIHLYDLESGAVIYMNRISSETIFTSTQYQPTSGCMVINRKGQVLSVSLNEDSVVPYILNNLGNTGLALALASRGGLSGADDLYKQQFNNLLNSGNYHEAAKIAASSPNGILRTPDTIMRLKNIQIAPGQISPILKYFSTLLDKGSLNKIESIELARPVLQQDKKALFEQWLKENKLESSEELGDIVRGFDLTLALAVYLRANVPVKVVACFAELGEFDKILAYCQKVNYTPDYPTLLQNIVRINPEKGVEFATQLVQQDSSKVDLERIVDIFLGQNLIQQLTAFLLDALKDNLPEQGHLQTRLLEVNLMNAPQVADAILGNEMFTHFDRPRIAQLCERAGLFQRALELYDDLKDIKKVVVNTTAINAEWLIIFFGKLTVDQTLECLHELLKSNIRQNLQLVVQAATKYSDLIGSLNLIKLFEEFKTYEGLYYYLQTIVNLSQDADVVFKFIEAAAKVNQVQEIERIARDNSYYNPEKVKNFLKDAKLENQLPLIIVCDRHNFIHDLVLYLYHNQMFKFIEVYVQRVNPSRTPEVIAGLLDVDCDESIIKALLQSVVGQVPIEALVTEVEKRNRLKILLPFLEATLNSGSQEPAVYDALAKIYIDSNNNPEKFLKENNNYNPLVVGKYCEKRDPYLAFIAYEKGQNDYELINITNENSMYKYQARYLVARANPELWSFVLDPENIHKRSLIDQVVGTAVPESDSPENVSIVVKSFMENDLPNELIEVLEKLIFEPSAFNDNQNLQNLLILTAIKADKSKVANYIERLDHYEVNDITKIAIENNLYEEAFVAYNKHELHSQALGVLIDHIMSLDRAEQYAEKIDTPELWSQLGKAQLDGMRLGDAIESYKKAEDPSNYSEVIQISTRAGKDEELISYLKMARAKLREPIIDNQLLISYALTDRLNDLKDLLNSPNIADAEEVGDRLYEEKNYKAAKILYSNISNWAKLASTLVYLEDYQSAVDCARKASNIKVWKQVNDACIENKEFRLAQICGLNLIVHAEELPSLVEKYEYNGYFDELISLFEQGLALERAHMGMFTELATLYSKYKPEKMMEHLKLFWSRINIPKVIKSCESAHLWPELIFLYCHYDEWDNAALAMMERSADAFDHTSFKEMIVKVANLEIYYKAINFYMAEQPHLITDLLTVLTARIDVARVVKIFQKTDNLPMIKPFLIAVQNQNNSVVNNALHDLLIEEEDHKSLRDSVDNFDRYDPIDLAQRLEKHDLIFFRQISAHLYKKNKKWPKSIGLSKEDKLWKDAIETAAVSQKPEICEDLLTYFVDIGNKECYVATLYTCYDYIKPDVVEEVSWKKSLGDYTKPYVLSVMREERNMLIDLHKDLEERKSKQKEQEKEDENAPIMGNRLLITQGNGMMPQYTGMSGF
ncbi:clathrin heavy chain, subunit of the major coat protein [Nadsonia fulvescens var. elongata DSM 6958]|uniref:Clathrin heavy chain n=1 Tax=Nadsonia fulvescens var. elongata DSM 6958 TaxID=857566 RepID=A0A1E3PTQ6_9ASCO|nr:clathrin heavy chain, subunit of the major coat protein [Nadsonia fulvescens var. elongata DSM 6958]